MNSYTARPILFITGLSGAGISTSLKALEDIGYEVFDNFPLSQVYALLNEEGTEDQPVALGFDSRTRSFSPENLTKMAFDVDAHLVFLNATNADLQRRFSETRRTHPLAKDRTVTDGIIYERQSLTPLLEASDTNIDTTGLSVHDLKHLIDAKFSLDATKQKLAVSIMSFGFKYGVPREVDMVLDARFLKNPHWDSALKPLSGKDTEVQSYIETDTNFEPFYQKVQDLIDFLLPNYTAEGKKYFTIAFGCTGGQHRSVYLTEKLAAHIKKLDYPITIRHRDL